MTLVCEEAGCPLAADGRCLEGIEDPAECPHTTEIEISESDSAAVEAPVQDEMHEGLADTDDVIDVVDDTAGAVAMVDLGGDESLSIPEAEAVAGRYSARVVLVAGAFFSGKTSLVAGLYGLFLGGPAGEWKFQGSSSLMALDARYQGKRASTGLTEPESQRTRDEDMRLLDLRVANGSRRVNLMFSDVRGEYFEDIVSGRPVAEAVSLAARSDVVVILLDGDQLADRFGRGSAVAFARQLIGGLTEPGGLRSGIRLALVVSKADKLDNAAREWLNGQLDGLASFARERGFGSVDHFMTAAFAKADHPEHLGLVALLEWTLTQPPSVPRAPVAEPQQDVRSFLRGVVDG